MGNDPILSGLQRYATRLRRLARSRQCRIQWINAAGQEFYNDWRPLHRLGDLEEAVRHLRADGVRAWVGFR